MRSGAYLCSVDGRAVRYLRREGAESVEVWVSGKSARRSEAGGEGSPGPRYQGWQYYRGANGSDPVRKDRGRLAPPVQAGLDVRMARFRDGSSLRQDHKPLGEGLHELRFRIGNNQFRLIFAIWGDRLLALDVFYKNQNKTSTDRAATRWRDWKKRNGDEPPSAGVSRGGSR